MADLPVGTVTFLFTDIEGSTPLWEQHPEAMQAALARHDAILHAAIKDNGGQIFKLIGDAFEASFTLPAQAVKAALAVQRALAAETWEQETGPIKVRMGIHTGPAEVHGSEYSGHTLNRVARIMAAGHGGQILLSRATVEMVRGGLPKDVQLKDLGEHPLKGLSRPEHLYQVVVSDLPQEFPPLVTKHVPRGYQLRELIGEGGFGEVYRAFHPDVGREVAVKIIRPELADQPEFIRRFEAEAQIVARLEHPRIVPLYDYWREPGGAFLVMRLLRGGSLHDLLSNGPLSLEQAGELLEQLAEALVAAHAQGIVHRDLKPDNILLDEAGNYYLSDFGIAKDIALEGNKKTGTLAMIGSPLYMSPEQMLGEAVTPQSDIYSLGEVLYEALAGECPFGDESLARLIDRQLHEPLPRLLERRPELPAGLDEVLQQATAKRPEERFPDAPAFADSFRAALSGAPLPVISMRKEATALELVNPYKGLRAFQEADTDDFFGRDALVERLLARLSPVEDAFSTNGHSLTSGRFLAVVGPSGSGKSSVVRAGLLPALRKGALPGSEQWFVAEMIPGHHPVEELEAALLRVAVNPPESLLGQLKEDHRGLLRAVNRILPSDEAVELLLVLDQFEEVFTLVEDPAETRHFLDILYAAVSEQRSRLRIVLTLRADFYDRPLIYPDFSELMRLHTELVLPLTFEELSQAIVRPAERAGAQLEEGLVAAMVSEVNEQPGALPLLQYALTELFERRSNHQLTRAAYRDIGGVSGALGRRAEEIYQQLDNLGKEAARQLFLRLVTLGEGVEDTRRRALQAELEALVGLSQFPVEDEQKGIGDKGKGTIEKVLDAYGRYRLLSFDRDPLTRSPTAEVAHEALLREWQRLREWLDESRDGLRLQRRLGVLSGEWLQANREASYLMRGERLDQIEAWAAATDLALTSEEDDYLQASLAERRSRRAEESARQAREAALERRSRNFLRVLVLVMAIATIVSLYLSWFAFRQRDSARLNEALATSRELVRFAEAELEDPTDPSFGLALLLSRQAVLTTWQADVTVLGEAERALRKAIDAAPILDKELTGHTRAVRFAAWSPDGDQILTAGADGITRLWDADSGIEVMEFPGHRGEINIVVWSPDGARFLTAGQDKATRIWDASTGKELNAFTGEAPVASAIWSPDGASILVAEGRTVKILGAGTVETVRSAQNLTGNFSYAAFSPAGDRFATGDDIDSIKIWDATMQGEPLKLEGNNGPVNSVEWSHDGHYLLSAHEKNLARIWDVEEASVWIDLAHEAPVQFAAWSPDDNRVATVTVDGRITIWDALTGQMMREWRAHDQILWSVAWSPDGSQILTADDDGGARIWEAKSLEERRSLRLRGPVLSVAWSPDGTKLLTAGGLTLSANIWEFKENSLVKSLPNPGSVEAVAWSPDGGQVASASLNTVYLWDANTGENIGLLQGPTGAIETVAWSPSGEYLVTGGQDRDARIWDLRSGNAVQVLKGHSGAVLSATWSADGSRIVTASGDGTARVWDAETSQVMLALEGHQERVNAAVFSPDGESILTAGSDQTARLWEARTGKLRFVLEGHRGPVWSAIWSPDGSMIATAGNDGFVLLWDPKTGDQIGAALQHQGAVWSVTWSPDGSQLASASQDGTVKISPVGIEGLLKQAEELIRRDPPEFSAEERCLYLHDCEG